MPLKLPWEREGRRPLTPIIEWGSRRRRAASLPNRACRQSEATREAIGKSDRASSVYLSLLVP